MAPRMVSLVQTERRRSAQAADDFQSKIGRPMLRNASGSRAQWLDPGDSVSG